MRLKPTKTTITVLGSAVGLVLLSTTGLLFVQNNALGETLRTVEAREAEVRDGQERERRREDALANLEADRERLRFLESGVSNAAYVPTLLKQLEEVAVQTNNRVLGVQPQRTQEGPSKVQQRRDPEAQAGGDEAADGEKKEEKKPEPYTPLVIQVALVGGFKSTQAFVERLTQFPKIISVDELQLRPHRPGPGEDPGSSLLDVEIKLTAFVMKEAPGPGVTAVAANPGDANTGAGGTN